MTNEATNRLFKRGPDRGPITRPTSDSILEARSLDTYNL